MKQPCRTPPSIYAMLLAGISWAAPVLAMAFAIGYFVGTVRYVCFN